MDLTPGQQIGTYRIVRLWGKGGMGAVYEVEHVQLGVHYAPEVVRGEAATPAADSYSLGVPLGISKLSHKLIKLKLSIADKVRNDLSCKIR